jgi:hypothetical protein
MQNECQKGESNMTKIHLLQAIGDEICEGCGPENIPNNEAKTFHGGIDTVLGIYRKTKVFCSSPFCCGNRGLGSNGT